MTEHCLDSEAFRRFYERHVSSLFRIAAARVGHDEAEDLVADVFVEGYRKLPAVLLEDDDGARAWLFVVLRNRLRSNRRRQRTARSKQSLVAVAPSTSDEYRLSSDLDAALVALPERQRTVLELRFFADLDVRSVGRLMELSDDGVRALSHRALRAVRQRLAARALATGVREDGT